MSVFNSPFNQVFHNPFGSPFNGDASSGTTWTPAEWFLASEQGAWYDPSDFTRYTGELGPEEIVDPGFNDPTKWTTNASWTVSGGKATHNGSVADYIYTAIEAPTVGEWYEATVVVSQFAAGSALSVYLGQSPAVGSATGVGTFKFVGKSPGTGMKYAMRASNATGLTTVIESFSVKKLTSINTATMFQDSAGTTPVTAVEQPVGKMLDKSGRGNHASQATSASRPVLSARKNLTTNSEAQSGNFGGASGGVTAVDGIARPMGTGRVLRRTTGAASYAYGNAAPTANATIAASCYVRRSDGAPLVFGAPTLANSALNDCVLVINGVGITPNATTVEDAGGGWYRLSASAVYTSSSIGFISYNTTVALDITGLQIEYGSAAGTYQRVNTATDYDSVGFPLYLKFDGVDDFLVTNSIDFTSIDKMTVVAGVTITSTGARIIYEHGANPEAGSGFGTKTGAIAAGDLTVTAYSTAVTSRRTDASALPIGQSTVLSHTIDIAGATAADEQQTRLNGVTPTYVSSGGTGTGNFTSQIFYIGRRGGTSMSMGGSIHQLIVRGAATALADIQSAEAFTAGKTGITL